MSLFLWPDEAAIQVRDLQGLRETVVLVKDLQGLREAVVLREPVM
jgi:hypothetical protein